MPVLPNLGDIPQAQFDRIVAAFPGTTGAEKTSAYQAWLTNNLIEFVEKKEQAAIHAEMQVVWQSRMDALRASLPARVNYPGLTLP